MTDKIQIKYEEQSAPFYYIRLGALLEYIQNHLMYIIQVDENNISPLLKFDTEVETNLMFIENLQVSVDPNICLVNRTIKDFDGKSYNFTNQTKQAEPFESSLFTGYNCYGQIMNIYINMKWVLLELDRLKDANTGKVVLIDFLNSILSSINLALGGINNLETTIDETTNTVIIRDKNPLPNMDEIVIPGLNKFYTDNKIDKKISSNSAFFDLFGYSTEEYDTNNPVYNKAGHASFIKDFSFTTEITPQLSTMLTVGATANSEVVGENSTAFSRFNAGLTDRFKKNISEPDPFLLTQELLNQILPESLSINPNQKQINDLDEEQKILIGKYASTYSRYLGYLRGLAAFKYNNGEAETYKNAVTNFTTYLQQIRQIAFKKQQLKTNKIPFFLPGTGFIPFNMSLTMDGLSGMKIYNKFNINTEYLPTNYPNTAEFIIKNINHKIENNKWNTTLESIVITKGQYKNKNGNKIPPQGGGQSTSPASSSPQTPVQESIDADFWSLVAISAAENFINNFQGMADVAQSIYNRLSAKVYGKSIKSIVVAPGQYEPTFRNPNDWRAIKDKETAITAYKNSRGISLEVATQTINNCVSALTSPLLKQNAKIFVGSRTEFLSAPPTSKDAVGVVEREPKNKNNAFFWNYSGKTLFYNKKIFTAQNPPSNLPQLT